MQRYFKIWLQSKNLKKVMAWYIQEEKDIPLTQLLFDKLSYGQKIKKYQQITEKQFERINKNKKYLNIIEIL